MIRVPAALVLCACINGCAGFQTEARPPLPAAERLELSGRGQVRVVERNAAGREALLLVHGYGASSASYRTVLPALAARFHVLAVDLPGFGGSDRREGDYSPEALADDLARILDAKGIDRADVVGHSWGGSVVLAFAQRHPDRLRRLVVISGFVYEDQLLPLMRWSRAPGLGELLFSAFYNQALGERLYLNFRDPSLVTEEVVDDVKKQSAREGSTAVALAAARGMRFGDHEAGYRNIAADTLLLWGAEDRVALPSFGVRLSRELPHSRLRVIPNCGHIPMWECRGDTLAALLDFLGPLP